MRITRADIDLWRAREMQGGRRLREAAPAPALERRFEAEAKKPATRRRGQVGSIDAGNAIPPLGDVLEETSGNVVVLRHLINRVLPALPMSEDVRQCASALFAEDMDHHLRVLDAVPRGDKEQEIDGESGQSEPAVAVPSS